MPAFSSSGITALSWQVSDLEALLDALTSRGVATERYPWLTQDARRAWQPPVGARVAWFKDHDGNLLSVAPYPGRWPLASARAAT